MIKTGSTICFAQSLIKADDVVIARANATFRVVPKKERSAGPDLPLYRAPKCQSAASRAHRSIEDVRTLADSSRDVG